MSSSSRLAERGQGMHDTWDSHENQVSDLSRRAKAADQPIAALLTDLRSRGMLDSTLVAITSEFGIVFGSTDDYGIHVAENPAHDFRAANLHLMGLNHERLTDVSGRVVQDLE